MEKLKQLESFVSANGIYAVLAHARHVPLRVRLWTDFLKHHDGRAGFWQVQ